MNWDAIAVVVELLAATAVIFSLVYVGKELSLNNRNQRLAALQAHNEAFRENISLVVPHSEIWISGLQNYPDLSPADNASFGLMIHASFRHIEQAHLLHEEGVLDNETYLKSVRLVCGLLAYRGSRNWWESRKIHFGDDFVEAVEELSGSDESPPMYDFDLTG